MKKMNHLGLLVMVGILLSGCSELLFWKKEPISVYQSIRIESENSIAECNITDLQVPNPESGLTYYWLKNRKINYSQGAYAGHLLHGKYQSFFPEGDLMESGQFKKGLKEGVWRNWGRNNQIQAEYTFSRGGKDGPFKEYVAGQLLRSGDYKDGVYNGKIVLHQNTGIEALVYEDGIVADTVFTKTP